MRSSGGNMSGLWMRSIRPRGAGCCLILCCLIGSTWASSMPERLSASSERSAAQNKAPRLSHQPEDQLEELGKSASVECPVEGRPEPQVEWFKDGARLEPASLVELHGKELVIIQLAAQHEGDYHCRASNQLGSVESRPFRLDLRRRPDPELRLEPQLVEAAPGQQVEFTCSPPASAHQRHEQASWRRNGRLIGPNQGRFRASKRGQEFVLGLKPVLAQDHNSSFTCQLSDDSESQQAARLLVMQPVDLDSANLGPPINELAANNQQPEPPEKRSRPSLRQTLGDLYELAKPTLLVLGLLLFVSLLSIGQLLYIRRRTRQNRYMKHQLFSSASGSGGSRGSSASAGGGGGGGGPQRATLVDPNHNCDPLLTSLMARTLSAGQLGASGKRWRSYRDHMRKVAACASPTVTECGRPHQNPTGANLYSQSLAAREQARNLLASGDHMRSLSNLSNQQQQQKSHLFAAPHQLGSHLNLPASESFVQFAADQRLLEGLLGAGWAQANNGGGHHQSRQAPPRQQPADEHYQLVNCSSLSPSSTSSVLGYSSNASSSRPPPPPPIATTTAAAAAAADRLLLLNGCSSSSSADSKSPNPNHYSTIESREPDEQRQGEQEDEHGYQRLNEEPPRRGQRTSTFVADSLLRRDRSSFRAPPQGAARARDDQLSPYAVSSVCANLPPVNPSEAMRALGEQFDVAQLMLASEHDEARNCRHNPQMPFDTPLPPPPPPPSSSQQQDNQPRRKCHR